MYTEHHREDARWKMPLETHFLSITDMHEVGVLSRCALIASTYSKYIFKQTTILDRCRELKVTETVHVVEPIRF